MRTYVDYILCIVRQTLDAVRLATEAEAIHERILREVQVAASGCLSRSQS